MDTIFKGTRSGPKYLCLFCSLGAGSPALNTLMSAQLLVRPHCDSKVAMIGNVMIAIRKTYCDSQIITRQYLSPNLQIAWHIKF